MINFLFNFCISVFVRSVRCVRGCLSPAATLGHWIFGFLLGCFTFRRSRYLSSLSRLSSFSRSRLLPLLCAFLLLLGVAGLFTAGTKTGDLIYDTTTGVCSTYVNFTQLYENGIRPQDRIAQVNAQFSSYEPALGFVPASVSQYYALMAQQASYAYGTVGTSANNIIKLDGNAKLPAVDGSQLTNLPGASAGTVATITSSGNWTVPTGVTLLKDVWIIAGGGGGGGNGGGGGAGGVRHLTNYTVTPATSITVVIGAGGDGDTAGSYSTGSKGGNSSFDSLIAYGGGAGAGLNVTTHSSMDGGNGGGGGNSEHNPGYGKGIGGLGWDGAKFISNDVYGGGGGGGAGTGGLSSITSTQNGDGGDGIDLSYYTGTSIGDSGWFGGGGGGGTYNAAVNTRWGKGGKGGGGNGGYTDGVSGIGHDGTANTGGGGGSSSDATNRGGNGGSGIIIIRY